MLVISVYTRTFSLLNCPSARLIWVWARTLSSRVAMRLFETVRQVQRAKCVPLLIGLVDGSILVLIGLRHFNEFSVIYIQIIIGPIIMG